MTCILRVAKLPALPVSERQLYQPILSGGKAMQVKDRMTPNPVTVTDDSSFENALHLMKEKKIRRLPIVARDGKLVGIVVQKDLFSASPSRATSLSVFEVHYLLSKLKMKDVMTKRVVTVGDDCPLEEAARIMVDYKIGCLPILKDEKLVGIITETDIFKTFVEILGGREKGLRLTLDVTEKKVRWPPSPARSQAGREHHQRGDLQWQGCQ